MLKPQIPTTPLTLGSISATLSCLVRVPSLPVPPLGEERRLLSRTVAGDRAESHTCLTLTFIFRQKMTFLFSAGSCTVDVAKEAVALVLELTVPVEEKEIVLTDQSSSKV